MTFKYKNVYINEKYTVVGPYEYSNPIGKYFDKHYDDLYMESKTFEQAEINLNKISFETLKRRVNKKIDVHIGSDLLNQLSATNYSNINNDTPLIGVYSACASSTLDLILASNMIDAKQISNAIVTCSSHNMASEKQFRNPTEYGAPKKIYSTFTTTGSASIFLSNEKGTLKVESGTIGSVVDMGITDVNNMGAVMASSCAKTIYEHLSDTKRDASYYDLILTGDLGCVGKNILLEYLEKEYNIKLDNLEDSACLIYDLNNKKYLQGGSGIACLPLVFSSYIFKDIGIKYKKILLVATGSLHNTTMCNQKLSIPSISHAISLEAIL